MKPLRLPFAHALFLLSLCIIAQAMPAPSPAEPQKPSTLLTKSTPIYVSDFELDAQDVQVDKGSIVGQLRPGILERPRKRQQTNPAVQAKKLVDTMSQSIVADLQKAGYNAQRLPGDDAKPAAGAWVHGVFTQVDEGSRLHRAVIGFGSGETKMELFVTLTNLASPERPLYESAQAGTSKKTPGAAITLNPYVTAAKFVVEQNAPEKTVKRVASQISKEVASHLQQPAAP
jgi:hypothetical protein